MIRDSGAVQVHAKIVDKKMHDFLSWTKLYLVHCFFNDLWSLKKTEKSPKTDAKKTGPFKDRKGEDRDHPKTGNCRTGTSLQFIRLGAHPVRKIE